MNFAVLKYVLSFLFIKFLFASEKVSETGAGNASALFLLKPEIAAFASETRDIESHGISADEELDVGVTDNQDDCCTSFVRALIDKHNSLGQRFRVSNATVVDFDGMVHVINATPLEDDYTSSPTLSILYDYRQLPLLMCTCVAAIASSYYCCGIPCSIEPLFVGCCACCFSNFRCRSHEKQENL